MVKRIFEKGRDFLKDTASPGYSFFQNRQCEYFPCHDFDRDSFNCLFCYCPLYVLGKDCGGNCSFTPEGIKDCSGCALPHSPGGFEYITSRFPEITQAMKALRGMEK